MLEIHPESHLDHLPEDTREKVLAFVLERLQDMTGFFTRTLILPDGLQLPCGLHGPIMGDCPVEENEVMYEARPGRPYASRLCNRPVRLVQTVTVVAGPYDGRPCVLYTVYGGPLTPREVEDPGLKTLEASEEAEEFWAEHALSAQ